MHPNYLHIYKHILYGIDTTDSCATETAIETMLQRHRDNKRHGNTARHIHNRMTMEANTRDIVYDMHPNHTKEVNRPLLCSKMASFVCGKEVSFILYVNK